jgi:hypothetical protein
MVAFANMEHVLTIKQYSSKMIFFEFLYFSSEKVTWFLVYPPPEGVVVNECFFPRACEIFEVTLAGVYAPGPQAPRAHP